MRPTPWWGGGSVLFLVTAALGSWVLSRRHRTHVVGLRLCTYMSSGSSRPQEAHVNSFRALGVCVVESAT